MDRGRDHHRAFLRAGRWSAVAVAGFTAFAAPLRAQGPAVSPVPSVAVPPAPSASPSTGPSAPPDAAARRRTAEKMSERRQRELAASEQEIQKRVEQLPPEEREAFQRNLKLWRELSAARRETVRKEAEERMDAEIDKALRQTGLRLDNDQREVFALRYRQERRRLERELQEKLELERARRLPVLVEGLKKEFAERAAAAGSAPTPPASVTPTPPPTVKPPAPSPSPKPSVPSGTATPVPSPR